MERYKRECKKISEQIEDFLLSYKGERANKFITYFQEYTNTYGSIEELKKKAQVSFVVDTLTYLHRGGRCSSIAALAGGVLKLHPKIVVSEGSMKADKKYRGKTEKAILDYTKELEDSLKEADEKRVFITHSGCKKELIDEVYAYLKELNHFNEIYVARAGGVISSHCGPGTLGILYLTK